MYKLALTLALAFGIMAFSQPNKDKSKKSDRNSRNKSDKNENNSSKNYSVFDQKDHRKKEDKGNKSNSNNHQDFDKKEKGKHNVSKNSYQNHNSKNKGKYKIKHYKKGHPNHSYIFASKPGHYSYKNYGQWRSVQARKRHKKYHPKYEYEAIDGFRLIQTRNVYLFNETDYKINLLRTRLAKKRKANEITVVQYDTYVNRIEVLEERRAGLNININL